VVAGIMQEARAKASAWRLVFGGAVLIRSPTRRCTAGGPATSSWAISSAAHTEDQVVSECLNRVSGAGMLSQLCGHQTTDIMLRPPAFGQGDIDPSLQVPHR
jgi:hypothetical protein